MSKLLVLQKQNNQLKKQLAAKANELKIQTALEKVRVIALRMKQPADMLKICRMISLQLQKLGVEEIRNVQTAIFYKDKGTYMNYEYYPKHDKTFITETSYNHNKVHKAFAVKMQKGKGEFFVSHVKGAKVKDWIAYQKTTNVFIDKYLETAFSLNYYWYSLGPVALGISTYAPLIKENKDLFKRFLHVFELAYRRYLDIEKAEAQAREAQVQLALERVRARTMAMQKSDELSETAYILFHEFKQLGDNPVQITIGIFKEEHDEIEFRITGGDGSGSKVQRAYNMSIHEPALLNKMYVAWKDKKKSVVIVLNRAEMLKWVKYRSKVSGVPETVSRVKKDYKRYVAVGFFSKGFISFSKTELIATETIEILERFAGVFDQTYTRFLDLQKAEAQAREAEIELALERVRARTMAMQKSEELQEVVHTVLERLKDLNVEFYTAIIILFTKDSKDITWWLENKENQKYSRILVPYTNITYLRDLFDTRKNGRDHFSKLYSFKEKNELFHHLFSATDFKYVPEKQRKFLLESEVSTMSVALSKNTGIHLTRYTDKAFSEADNEILKRFAKVFEQAYTRFLDLQKAESQAREAQVQLALERVRARTMAMQKQNDLLGVLNLLFEQLVKLGVQLEVANFSDGMPEGDWNLWITGPTNEGTVYTDYVHFPKIDHPYFQRAEKGLEIYKAGGTDLGKEVFTKKEKDSFQNYLFSQTIYKDVVPDEGKQYIYNKPGLSWSAIILKDTWVSIARYNTTPFTNEEDALLRRFANAFGLAYTRFLDLQKAEAQAREAQVQLALERVRARTMAMQKQNDLQAVLDLLVEQLVKLGVNLEVANFSNGIPGRDWDLWIEVAAGDGTVFNNYVHFPRIDHPYFHHVEKNIETYRKDGTDLFKDVFSKEEKDSWQDYINSQTIYKDLTSEEIKQLMYEKPGYTWSMVILKDTWVSICRFNTIPFSDEEDKLLRRFANAFSQAYTRFLDLQKAEAQARESQIQLALERVRARTMAMQKSDELSEAVFILFQQFKELGENPDQATIGVINEKEHVIEYWVTMYGNQMNKVFKFSIDEPHVTNKIYHAWKKGMKSLLIDLSGKELSEFMTYRAGMGGAAVNFNEKRRIINVGFFSKGLLNVQSNEERSEESIKLLERFASVFEQTYTRFLDLQKAEAQAKEAQIEVALERVRARAMAMHESGELKEIALELRKQMGLLGQKELETCAIHLYDESPDYFQSWAALRPPNTEGDIIQRESLFPKRGVKIIEEMMECYQSNQQDYVLINDGAKAQEFFEMVKQHSAKVFEVLSESFKGLAQEDIKAYWSVADFKGGSLVMTTMVEPGETTRALLRRFANVFGLAYRRFMDLKQAEVQAREAEIELGLERVRSRAMAMQSSEELHALIGTVFTELTKLDLTLTRCIIWIFDDATNAARWWMANSEEASNPMSFFIKYHQHPAYLTFVKEWKNQNGRFVYDLKGKDKIKWDEILFNETELKNLPEVVKNGMRAPERVLLSASFNNFGGLNVASLEPLSDEHFDILLRFAKVFDLTYTRFNDLKQAEAQAREATIEAALEKVRGKAMAMHNSNDVAVTASMVFTELRKLGIKPIRCGVGLLNSESRKAGLYSATSSTNEDSLSLIGWVQLEKHPVLEKIYESWIQQEDYFPELEGEQLISYYKLLLAGLPVPVPDFSNEQKQFGHFISFSVGCLYAWSEIPYKPEQINILKRFAGIIDLTFRRYLELQQSEANAKEAVKQSVLDRIRADIASMRTTADLNRIIPLVWNELTILGLPFIRCGVFIMDNEYQLIHTFLSTPEGKAIAAFKIPYDTPGKIKMIPINWKNNTAYVDHWNDSDFTDFANTLLQQEVIDSAGEYLAGVPHGGFYLHFLPFLQGMMYVGNTTELNDEELSLVQSVADAFSTAYARYEDFNKLEEAKKQVDKTLVELKQTQQQLVQSEKMASLGELTAGIAHEIQNPLNFVNNFSEVSNEMVDEMKEELSNGNAQLAMDIADDIKQNLEKILHHGKRADAIVKGMLQHSRKSSGQKEATDINALCDEYLRLSYHGLRAKDKSFNATIETGYGESIGKINVVPQDIGRVLLNLYNNAFYACAERSRSAENEQKDRISNLYQPTVCVSTRKEEDSVIITVSDNGNGIPQNIVDKIFQPFFTTKPTGSGTGLGLSLSYDIVKSHGGEIKVESKEEEGTTFLIRIPI